MTYERAIKLAIAAIEEQIHDLAVDANLHDKFNYIIPRTTKASKDREVLRAAIEKLQASVAKQTSFLEAA